MSEWKSLSSVRLFVTPWTAAHQAPLSLRLSRQGFWSRLSFPSPGDLPNPRIKSRSPELQADSLLSESPGKPHTAPLKFVFYDPYDWIIFKERLYIFKISNSYHLILCSVGLYFQVTSVLKAMFNLHLKFTTEFWEKNVIKMKRRESHIASQLLQRKKLLC